MRILNNSAPRSPQGISDTPFLGLLYMENSKQKGNRAIGAAIAYYTSILCVVSIPLNDNQDYDLTIDKEGVLYKVQVKYTSQKSENGTYKVTLRSISGSSGKTYSTVKDSSSDLLFIYTENGYTLEIPVKEITQVSTLTLTKEVIKRYSVMDELV